MAKERRCNLFDDRGRPRRLKDGTLGCSRDASVCHFAHPHERAWETAHPSFPPKHDFVIDSDSDFYYSLVDKETERGQRERWKAGEKKPSLSFYPKSPPHRKDSTTTRGSPGPPSRKSTSVSGTTKRGRSPAYSTSSEQMRKDDRHHANDVPSRRSTSHRSRSHSKDKGKGKERTNLHKIASPSESHISDARSSTQRLSTLPPEPPKPPLPRVPEVPKVPSFVSDQPSTSSAGGTMHKGSKGLSLDEQRSVWHERIDLMFSSITLRRDYTKLESDLSQVRLLQNSLVLNTMPESDRARINARKVALEDHMDMKRKEINETIVKLAKSEFWPILRTSQISEMEKALGEAKKYVLEVKNLLEDVKNSCAALFKANAADLARDSDRPTKRRKLESPLEQSSGENAQAMSEDTAKELDALRDKLIVLDGHLANLQNEIIQRDQVVSDEIEFQIEARLQEEEALYPSVSEEIKTSQTDIEAIVDARNKEIMHTVTTTGQEIEMLAMEIAELITKVDDLEARCRVLEAENQDFRNRLSQDGQDHAKSQDALVRRDKEIEAIAAALQAYISQIPGNQTVADLPSSEYILESLDSHFQGLFRERFGAALIDAQREVIHQVQENHNRALDIFSPNIMLLLKMVNLISARVGKSDMDDSSSSRLPNPPHTPLV